MAAGLIVEAIDVIGHIVQRQFSVLVDVLLDLFLFQGSTVEVMAMRIVKAGSAN